MADETEPRRSGRATKGQYTKDRDIPDEINAKRKGSKGKATKTKVVEEVEEQPEDEEEDEIIRCICGQYEEEEDEERDMICCDNCSAWQHNDCMLLPYSTANAPEQYFCEQCRPEDHKVLLDAIARGEKPWEEVAKRRQEARLAKKKKGGKRGRKSTGGKSDIQESDKKSPTPVGTAKSLTPGVKTTPGPGPATTPGVKGTSASTPGVKGTPASTPGVKGTPASTPGVKATPGPGPASTPGVKGTPATTPAPKVTPPVTTKATPASSTGIKPTSDSSTTPAITGQKRKLEDASIPTKDNKKARSTSAKASSPPISKNGTNTPPGQNDMVETPDELINPGRKSAAKALIKLFMDQAKTSQKSGIWVPSQGQTISSISNKLGIAVEHAMYASLVGSGDLNDGYKNQLRTILHNIKANPALRDRLLDGHLPPHSLAVMNAEDMASEEQQQRDAAIKKEAEKQAMIIEEQGPRIRRTHKGEEYVDEDHQVAAEPTYPPPTRRDSQVGMDTTPDTKSPTSPSQAEKHLFSNTRKPPTINTQVRRPSGTQDRKSSANFNIQEVWSSVQSPDHDQQFPPISHRPVVPPGAQPDAEIDALLKDEDNESEPYSPKDVNPDIVWTGRLDMEPISGFRGSAKFTAGADAQGLGLTWDHLMPSNISINGRIDTKRADTYLCGLRYSNTTDVIVVSVRPPDQPTEKESFDKLFNYFKERDRYGVVAKHTLSAVKDTYIMPIEAGATNEQKPEFLQLLDNDNIESPNPERVLLIVFVIRFSELAGQIGRGGSINSPVGSSSTPVGPISTPVVPISTPGGPISTPGGPISTNPSQHGTQFGFNGPTTPQQHYSIPPVSNGNFDSNFSYHSPQPSNQLSPAAAAAHQVLPLEMVNSPAVQQLIYQAPNLGVAEMNVLKDCIQENPAAASDLQVLTTMLMNKQNGN